MPKILFDEHVSIDQLPAVGSRIATLLPENFVLWLDGPMGAGKTTITAHVLRGLGLSENVPVLSPTYTYMNEYQIGDRWYAHMDLYRLTKAHNLDQIISLDARNYRGIFVEWPSMLRSPRDLPSSHVLELIPQGEFTRLLKLIES